MNPYDIIVLAANPEDMQMGKNGGAVLVAAGWSGNEKVQDLGIRVDNASELETVLNLVSNWPGQWWYVGTEDRYQVKVLSDLSGYGQSVSQQEFGQKVTQTVKQGGPRLNALLSVTSRSLLEDGFGELKNLVWGVYPSSSSANYDNEVLSDFTHRLRTTVSLSRMANRGVPLFIRHTPSSKRSKGGGGDRKNPSEQIQTIYLNPYYKENRRLVGKHVVVVDDCATHGVSFAVAAAFLLKAGAKYVTGVALGKFGNQLNYYDINILTDPFAPIDTDGYEVKKMTPFKKVTSSKAQRTLRDLIP